MTRKGTVNFLISTALFIPWAIMWIVSLFVVLILLKTKWTGKTSWFGNYKWGRGIEHYKANATTYWKQYWFLCFRNPVSNFGTTVLAVSAFNDWVWYEDEKVIGNFYWMYGWKNPSGESPSTRAYVYRPWFHTSKNFKSTSIK